MVRYARIKNDDHLYVWDQEKDILYSELFLGDNKYKVAPINIYQLSKFAPDADEDGEFDNFPGEVVSGR